MNTTSDAWEDIEASEDRCNCRPFDMSKMVVVALVITTLSYVMDEFVESRSFIKSSIVSNPLTVSRILLAICCFFVLAVWSISACVQIRYLQCKPSSDW